MTTIFSLLFYPRTLYKFLSSHMYINIYKATIIFRKILFNISSVTELLFKYVNKDKKKSAFIRGTDKETLHSNNCRKAQEEYSRTTTWSLVTCYSVFNLVVSASLFVFTLRYLWTFLSLLNKSSQFKAFPFDCTTIVQRSLF